MKTTVELDDDVAEAIEQLRRKRGLSVSEAVNELARRGAMAEAEQRPFVQRTDHIGLRRGVHCTGDILSLLDELDASEHHATEQA